MNWAPAPACLWVAELWASFEGWDSFGMMGCRWVEALERLGGAGRCLWVGWALALPALGPHLPGLLLCPQVLDGLLAQYGTVENVEQGKMVQRGPHPCKIPSAAPQLCSGCRKLTGMKPSYPSSTGLKWVSL